MFHSCERAYPPIGLMRSALYLLRLSLRFKLRSQLRFKFCARVGTKKRGQQRALRPPICLVVGV